MSKLTRFVQKVFGSSAGGSQIAQFGSLAAGAPAFTTNPATIQALGNYLTGWYGAVVGANSPAIEDMNALCYLFAYQLTYLMQQGVAEWDTSTIYYKGSLASDDDGLLYASRTDANTGNALSNATHWTVGNGRAYNKIVPSPSYPTLSSVTFADGDSVLIVKDVTESTQILVAANDVRIDCAFNATIVSTLAAGSLFKVTGSTFRSNNLLVRASGALAASGALLELAGVNAIVSAAWLNLNNAAIALTTAVKMSGSLNDITSAAITVSAGGTYTNTVVDTGTNNDSRIRGA